MSQPAPEHQLKLQLARELCAILDGYSREVGAGHLQTHTSELSRLRHGDLRRFSLTRILRFIARLGYDLEVHLKKTPRLEERPQLRHHPTTSVVRSDYYGRRE
jgi:predicted XRE-type DNA-binding protein